MFEVAVAVQDFPPPPPPVDDGLAEGEVDLHLAAAGLSLFDDDSAAARPHRDDWTALLAWLALRECEPRSDAAAATALRSVSG